MATGRLNVNVWLPSEQVMGRSPGGGLITRLRPHDTFRALVSQGYSMTTTTDETSVPTFTVSWPLS
jgi:hypothetical protein